MSKVVAHITPHRFDSIFHSFVLLHSKVIYTLRVKQHPSAWRIFTSRTTALSHRNDIIMLGSFRFSLAKTVQHETVDWETVTRTRLSSHLSAWFLMFWSIYETGEINYWKRKRNTWKLLKQIRGSAAHFCQSQVKLILNTVPFWFVQHFSKSEYRWITRRPTLRCEAQIAFDLWIFI